MAAGTAAVPVRELVEHGAVAGDGPFHDGGEVSEAVDEAWMCVMMVCVCVWGGGGRGCVKEEEERLAPSSASISLVRMASCPSVE